MELSSAKMNKAGLELAKKKERERVQLRYLASLDIQKMIAQAN